MKTILIPTDFSEPARNALAYALRLFGHGAYDFVLLNAYEEPRTTTSFMISLKEILHESSVDSLREELEWVLSTLQPATATVRTESIYGSTAEAIASYCEEHDVAAVVMGTTGSSGIREVVIGSNTAEVFRQLPCPVIAIPAGYEYADPRSILFPSDAKDLSQALLPEVVTDMIRAFNATIHVLSVVRDGDAQAEKQRIDVSYPNLLQGVDHVVDVVVGENIEHAITQYAYERGMDMVVTVPKKNSWFARLMNPSVSRKLAQHLHLPVMALPSV